MLFRYVVGIVGSLIAATSSSVAQQQEWTLTRDIALVSPWRAGNQIREDKITAELFRPNGDGRMPAAVIVNSSGGVTAHTELFYGRLLASHGVAALVVDSFVPRGILRTIRDQSQLRAAQSAADAAAGFRWLAAQPWIDPSRIIVMGMSKGAVSALVAAIEADRRIYGTTDARFAAHVSIAPGCGFSNEDARSTGAPIFFMLAELDNYTPIRPCLDLAERIRKAGNPNVRLAIYPGVYHTYESIGGVAEITAEHSNCNVARNSKGQLTDRSTGRALPPGRERALLLQTCIKTGPVTVGGDPRVKSQAAADMLQFLRDAGIVEDRQARAVVPDCASIADGIHRRNCVRARAGWTGDLVALARAYRYPGGIARDDEIASRLFRFAAERGHPQAKWELALMLRGGAGINRDVAEAKTLLEAAAADGEPAAMNLLGVFARDGTGRPRNDFDAVAWFRRAADLRHPYALANLGRMHWNGRGGLPVNRAEAVKLYRMSAHYENAFGRLYLAEALDTGDGAARDQTQALELYRAVAAQEREPEAKRQALEALGRLGQAR